MYDIAIIGEGLSGLLTALAASEQGWRTALVTKGVGRLVQSSGVIDLIPGQEASLDDWLQFHGLKASDKQSVIQAVTHFQKLMNQLHLPYHGSAVHPVSLITAAGQLKQSVLYPESFTPIPEKGTIVFVSFDALPDFQGSFAGACLAAKRPDLSVGELTVHLNTDSERPLNPLDIARLLEQRAVRQDCIDQIRSQLSRRSLPSPDLLVFPAVLGIAANSETLADFQQAFSALITEAPGLPPNATAWRLFQTLRQEALRRGVRFYMDTSVNRATRSGNRLQTLNCQSACRSFELRASHIVLATGGVLGGGLDKTGNGMHETALDLTYDSYGRLLDRPENLHLVGAALGEQHTSCGITGGLFTIFSCAQAIQTILFEKEGCESHA